MVAVMAAAQPSREYTDRWEVPASSMELFAAGS